MPSAPLNEEQQRRVAAVMALVREIADVVNLDEIVSALLQAAAVWYDLDARGFRRAADGDFVLAAVLPGATPSPSARVIGREIISRHPEFARVTGSELEALGGDESSGDLLVLPLPSGNAPLWLLTFAGGVLADAEPVLRGLSPLLDIVVDRWRLRQGAAAQTEVLGAISAALANDEPLAGIVADALRRAASADRVRLTCRTTEGRTQVVAACGDVTNEPSSRTSTSTVTGDVATVTFDLGGNGTAWIEAAAAEPKSARLAIFPELARSIFLPWFAGAIATASAAPVSDDVAIPDLTDRVRGEIATATRFGRGTAVLSIAFVEAFQQETPAVKDARRTTARAVARELRRDDAVGRIAGADLAVLVTDVTPEVLPHAVERVRRILASAQVAGRAPAAVIGRAVFPSDAMFADQLLDVARTDAARQIAALRQAKSEGAA